MKVSLQSVTTLMFPRKFAERPSGRVLGTEPSARPKNDRRFLGNAEQNGRWVLRIAHPISAHGSQ
jgi:hypothetical protein